MRNYRSKRSHRQGRNDGSLWLSFSDLMSSLLMIIILVLFYLMYQYFEMYEINMAEIARQQYDLDQANATLEAERKKLTEAEQQMLAQQIRLNAAEDELADAEAVLEAQQSELADAQSLLTEKEAEIEAQQLSLAELSAQLNAQKSQLTTQQNQLATQQNQLATQQDQIAAQQAQLDNQEEQLEQLVGLRTRIIESLSQSLKASNIAAEVDPATGSITLESDVLFSTGKYDLTPGGMANVDSFLPIYLDVLLSEENRPYVSEIIIEGHTDPEGTYLENLTLSMQRAAAVANYVLDGGYHGIPARQRAQLRNLLSVNGRSYSELIYNERGEPDWDASRRVVFKFRLTDERMIEQLKSILESD